MFYLIIHKHILSFFLFDTFDLSTIKAPNKKKYINMFRKALTIENQKKKYCHSIYDTKIVSTIMQSISLQYKISFILYFS